MAFQALNLEQKKIRGVRLGQLLRIATLNEQLPKSQWRHGQSRLFYQKNSNTECVRSRNYQ